MNRSIHVSPAPQRALAAFLLLFATVFLVGCGSPTPEGQIGDAPASVDQSAPGETSSDAPSDASDGYPGGQIPSGEDGDTVTSGSDDSPYPEPETEDVDDAASDGSGDGSSDEAPSDGEDADDADVATEGTAAFVERLQSALAARDYDALAGMMHDPMVFGAYASEWYELPVEDAIAELQDHRLASDSEITFSESSFDLSVLLDGQDPTRMLGPDIEVAQAFHSAGWGADGQDDAIIFVTREEDGLAWRALLYAPGGFPIGQP